MSDEELKYYCDICRDPIRSIAEKNLVFCNIEENIKVGFFDGADKRITGTCSRETNTIRININCARDAFESNNWSDIEYFILHELRHIYQHIQIKKYKDNKPCDIDEYFVLKWIDEESHYEKATDENGNENPEYFKQDSEFDAYAFAYAVMKYKYGSEMPKIYRPSSYKKDFDDAVSHWIKTFCERNIPKSQN